MSPNGIGATPLACSITRWAAPISLNSAKTRFMILVQGGDNPDRGKGTDEGKLGLRFQNCDARNKMRELRAEFLSLGTPVAPIVRGRKPGAKASYKPHLAILSPGAVETDEIRKFGEDFRAAIRSLSFDRISVRAS